MTMPCRWGDAGLAGFAGPVRLVRRFGYPGRIDAHERVWLTIDGIEGTATLTLNDQALGPPGGTGPFAWDITPLLRVRNELVVTVTADSDRGGLWGETALEVRRTAFLRDVRARRDGERLLVSGTVAGTAERPLELYLLCDGSTAAYARVEAGQPFTLTAEAPGRQARVELVDGATIWYAVDVPVEERS
jgi:hypothetical protein